MKNIQLKILDPRIGKSFLLPQYATESSAGMDLCACLDAPLTLHPQQTQLVSTGIAIYIKDANLAGLILPRSGLGHRQGIILGNSVGLIDADYQGELKISCFNRSTEAYELQPGERFAQLVIVPIAQVTWQIVDDFIATARNEKGFGHTGR